MSEINRELMNTRIAIIGLGYVGLPLAVEFGKKYSTIGFDINQARIQELKSGHDATLEVENQILQDVLSDNEEEIGLLISNNPDHLLSCNFYIITVPTPTDKNNRPVLIPTIGIEKSLTKVIALKIVPSPPTLIKRSKLSFNSENVWILSIFFTSETSWS